MIRLIRRIRGLATVGCGLLFPPCCVCCNREIPNGSDDWLLCAHCLADLGPTTWHGCRRCAGKVPDDGLPPDGCRRCRNAPLKFDAAITLGSYHAGLRDVVLRMKRPSHDMLSTAMGKLLAQRREEQLSAIQADMVVPIPMFWTRRLGRGINSPDILARCLGKSLGIPVRRNILVRRRNTLPQADLPPSRRFLNMRGAFRIRHPEALENACVLLVDDILTTGATCSEAAKMLKEAGAANVAVAVIARTVAGNG